MSKFSLACLASISVAIAFPGSAAAQFAPPSFSQSAYRINPGDELDISVWGEDRLKSSVRVLPDGTFAFPLVGQIYATGKLPAEIERQITVGLQPQYRGAVPQVTVSVRNPSGFQFSVVGKVKSPGTFTPGRYVNALEALSMAGGPTEFAQVGDIRIVRKVGSSLQSIRVRLAGTLRGAPGIVSQNDIPSIQSGDTMVVP
ncbi:MAG: polysaccharide biosynthesis/export family protein [Sphingomicrobium sp.]|nr:polysaccharide biosynthesis/export family protein [Sphingomonadales bacterium]